MKRYKYKILVLTDLKSTTKSTLKSTVSLAKMLNASVDLFHVKKPTDVVKQENQLATMRSISREHVSTKKELQGLTEMVAKDYDFKINSAFAFGNIKAEISSYIKKSNPDIIVLGKRKQNPLRLSGDNVTDYVLKSFKGSILITPNSNVIEPNKGLSLGLLNNSEDVLERSIGQDLLEHTNAPLKAFKIVKNSGNAEPVGTIENGKTLEFIFEENDNSLKNLSNYLVKNDINLAYLKRERSSNKSKTQSISQIIGKLDIPVLLSNEQEVA